MFAGIVAVASFVAMAIWPGMVDAVDQDSFGRMIFGYVGPLVLVGSIFISSVLMLLVETWAVNRNQGQ